MKKLLTVLFILFALFFIKTGSSYAYDCTNRDPACPTSTFDCMAINTNSTLPWSCPSPDCQSPGSSGTEYCAYPKGTTPPQEVPPPQPTSNTYDCEHRAPECNTTQFPTCQDFASSNFSCDTNVNCSMTNGCGILDSVCTHSCAYNKTQPPPSSCKSAGDTTCTGTSGSQGDCCSNLLCQPQGADHTALGNGTCVQAPPSLGSSCITCLPGNSYNNGNCYDSSGNKTNPVASVYCDTATQTCIQGTGCKTTSTNNGQPAAPGLGQGTYGGVPSLQALLGILNSPPGNAPHGGYTTLAQIISVILGILIFIAVLLCLLYIIWGGLNYIMSEGDKQKAAAARQRIIMAIIGLIIVFLAFFIINIIFGFFFSNGGPTYPGY